ncbi:UbiA family prenyltransferase [Haladaptatus pallidirubidus]|uniref:UbiA family prenyltransferase n=1 Tax=Haladaptatus pallidirubidus TaxID=1008152 RepID=A0AAV3UJ35_9EURY|nr:UbiA family prenyltransferase [Haladaptatus pallidirubidus]
MSRKDGSRHWLTAYATLVRLPNLFTAPPDVVLGVALIANLGYDVSIRTVAGLAIASVLLYAAGTTLNDYFDTSEDIRERPERPIPSKEVSRGAALIFGISLLVGGIVVALTVSGKIAGVVAGSLALVILFYDSLFKGSTIGFLFMGGCRGLNVLLGMSAFGFPTTLPPWVLTVPVVIVVYIAGVTYMAERETGGGDQMAVMTAVGGTVIATLGVIGLLVMRSPSPIEIVLVVVLLIGFVGWTGQALRAAYDNPVPETIGPAVGACVLGLTVLDAAFAATVGSIWSLVALAFVIPAVGFSRLFEVT